MSKYETPLTRRYWREIGGTLIEEFPAVLSSPNQGRRLLDGVVILDSPYLIVDYKKEKEKFKIEDRDIVVIQTKAKRLGMYLLGQALFSRHLMIPFRPRSIDTVAICIKGDAVLEPLAAEYGIKVVVYQD